MFRKRVIALVLCLLALLSLAACGEKRSGYYITSVGLDARTIAVSCREGDPLFETLYAATQVRIADGTAAQLSTRWFGENLVNMEGKIDALSGMEIQPGRVLVVGYDPSTMPLSGRDAKEEPLGFDVEFAKSVCELLGWEYRAIPISSQDLAIELASGEVDCVWGGIGAASDAGVQSFTYLETEYVLVSRRDARVKKAKAVKDKSVCYPQFAEGAAETLEIADRAATAVALGDTEACVAALQSGRCDAVLTDSIAAAYYAR